MRHEIARDPVVGVVEEDFQWFSLISLAPEEERRLGAVAYKTQNRSYSTSQHGVEKSLRAGRWGLNLVTGLVLSDLAPVETSGLEYDHRS